MAGLYTDTISNEAGTTTYLSSGTLDNVALGSSVTGKNNVALGWQLLSSVTAATSTNVEFAGTFFSSTYDHYMIKIKSGQPNADDNQLQMRFSLTGGTYPTSGYSYVCNLQKTDSLSGSVLSASSGEMVLGQSIGHAADEFFQYTIYLSDPTATAFPTVRFHGTVQNTSASITNCHGSAQYNTAAAWDKVKFFHNTESVTIRLGVFTLYGLNKS